MSATGQRNNNKAFPNIFTYAVPSTGTQNITICCFICRKLWDATSAAGNFKTHLIDDHGFTDVG